MDPADLSRPMTDEDEGEDREILFVPRSEREDESRPIPTTVQASSDCEIKNMVMSVLQISGAGHWFLEGWIGNHSVDFLVDSGSAVTALIVLLLLSDFGAGWSTGGCLADHFKEVTGR